MKKIFMLIGLGIVGLAVGGQIVGEQQKEEFVSGIRKIFMPMEKYRGLGTQMIGRTTETITQITEGVAEGVTAFAEPTVTPAETLVETGYRKIVEYGGAVREEVPKYVAPLMGAEKVAKWFAVSSEGVLRKLGWITTPTIDWGGQFVFSIW